MRTPSLAFRARLLILAIVAIAWLATRDSRTDDDAQAGAAAPAATSHVIVAGKASGQVDGQ